MTLLQGFQIALHALRLNPLRSFLTMLGIVIGVAAVISVVALGTGSQQRILAQISAIGTNTIQVFPGTDFGDERSGKIRTHQTLPFILRMGIEAKEFKSPKEGE